jgi:hypothetical protein
LDFRFRGVLGSLLGVEGRNLLKHPLSVCGAMDLGKGGEVEVKRLVVLLTVATLMIALVLPAGVVGAQEKEHLTVEVGPTAKLIDDGQAVQVKVSCEPVVDHVLESLLFVQQEDAYGEGFGFPVVCDGKTRVYIPKVEALDGPFHRGEAFVSAFALVCLDETCENTAQGQETRQVKVVGS